MQFQDVQGDQLASLTRDQADALGFGIVRVDDEGKIELYNRWEAEMAGVPPTSAEGRNFFTQVAPCTNNRLVYGKFKEGVGKGELDLALNYTFTYKMKPTNVKMRLVRSARTNKNFVLVAKP